MLRDFENRRRVPTIEELAAIRGALEAKGVIFVEGNGDGPGVRLRKPIALSGRRGTRRQRGSAGE